MSSNETPEIELFLGAPIEESSELEFLKQITADLQARQAQALIFANFRAGKFQQQIDFMVVTLNCACVIELKNYKNPVFGDINGQWEQRSTTGDLIRSLGKKNPYVQARDAKYAISDEMDLLSRDHPKLPPPPDGRKYYATIESVVCIFPDIPEGSQVTQGDFKTYVKGYPEFLKFLLSCSNNPGWQRDHWLNLALRLSLQKDRGTAPSCIPTMPVAIQESEAYITRFLDFYGRNLAKLVSTDLTIDGKPGTPESLLQLIESESNFQVIGPSGSGKTHLIKHLAIRSISLGFAPLFAPAKYFSGRFSELLDRSILHLHPGNFGELQKSIVSSKRKPFLIIDGLNECPARIYQDLLETIQAFTLRYNFSTLLTSQIKIDLPSASAGPVAELKYLTDELKKEVASAYLSKPDINLEAMLPALRTPLDIFVATQIAQELGEPITKYGLFNAYARKCLSCGEDSSLAFRILTRTAQDMGERLITAVPLPEFLRNAETFTESLKARPNAIATVLATPLVEIRQGNLSFSHEMFQRIFEAEAILSTGKCEEKIANPRNYHLAEFVLQGVSDRETLKKLLPLEPFRKLLSGVLKGDHGKHAAEQINSDIHELFQKGKSGLSQPDLVHEAGKGPMGIGLRLAGIQEWGAYDLRLMTVVGQAITDGYFIEPLLTLIKEAETICFEILKRKKFLSQSESSLKNELFALLYVWHRKDSSMLPQIFSAMAISSKWYDRESKPSIVRLIESVICQPERQPLGVLYLVNELITRSHKPSPISQLPRFFRFCWDTGIYNLRFSALDAIQAANNQIEGSLREEIIDTIEKLDWERNVFLSTQIVETLSLYGATEPPTTFDHALEEINRLLNPTTEDDDEINKLKELSREWENQNHPTISDNLHEKELDEVRNLLAYNIYSRIFEDVFQGIYYHAIESLGKTEQARFLNMAALGAPDYSFFADAILRSLLKLDDPISSPAFKKWAAIPDPQSVNKDDAVASFVLALIGLARYTDEPPLAMRPLKDDEAAWQCFREILFWLYKLSMEEQTISQNCDDPWRRLSKVFPNAAIDPLMRIQKAMSYVKYGKKYHDKDLVCSFPLQVKDIIESTLPNRLRLTSLFGDSPHFKEGHGEFMVDTLKEVGDQKSIPYLEKLLESPELGQRAAEAIKEIRTRI